MTAAAEAQGIDEMEEVPRRRCNNVAGARVGVSCVAESEMMGKGEPYYLISPVFCTGTRNQRLSGICKGMTVVNWRSLLWVSELRWIKSSPASHP